MAKRQSIGNLVLKKLSDITNLQTAKVSCHDEKLPEMSETDKVYVDQLIKERRTMMKLIAERNQIIELTGTELQNLRVSLQKLQLQNWNLAQSNSQMIAELNFGRERVKALQHELVCKEALLKTKNFGREAKTNGNCKETFPQELDKANEAEKPHNRRRIVRSQSMGHPTTSQVKADDKVENKRRCLKRHSAKFKSRERDHQTENYFEIEEANFRDINQSVFNYPTGEGERRSSTGRPPRRAVGNVQSYKEMPLNAKMRR